mgnify:CR=1 FL=1
MKNDRLEHFKGLLKERGLKVTSQRLAILGALLAHPQQHLTAEDIYELVRKDWPDIGLATVYRNIQLLSDMNLIDSLNLNDGFVRYEIGDEGHGEHHHHHHHLLEDLEERIFQETGFSVSDHEVKLYGICEECRRTL